MSMTFPTLESLMQRAKQRGFRQPHDNEMEAQYRAAFADFMQDVDMVEAGEIRLSGETALPMDFVMKADPLSALAVISGMSRDEVASMFAVEGSK